MHVVIMAGDLNFRLQRQDADGVLADIAQCAEKGDFSELLKSDELSIAMKNKTVFTGFSESIIQFPPSFKFYKKDQGMCLDFSRLENVRSVYKVEGSDQHPRIPSYVDRVLWYTLPGCEQVIESEG